MSTYEWKTWTGCFFPSLPSLLIPPSSLVGVLTYLFSSSHPSPSVALPHLAVPPAISPPPLPSSPNFTDAMSLRSVSGNERVWSNSLILTATHSHSHTPLPTGNLKKERACLLCGWLDGWIDGWKREAMREDTSNKVEGGWRKGREGDAYTITAAERRV